MKPTMETYAELQEAYDYFNVALFEAALPECLITLQREKHSYGYYASNRFVNKERLKTDEIAMNPSYFSVRSAEDTLATLVHEISHLWQVHFGNPGRGRYHNKEWGDKMEALGLMPSATGKEGGRRTGDQMSHYILRGEPFDRECQKLLTQNYKISWADRFPPREAVAELIDQALAVAPMAGEPSVKPVERELKKWGIDVDQIPAPAAQTREKFTCPKCRANAWGKPSLNIRCGDCDQSFVIEC